MSESVCVLLLPPSLTSIKPRSPNSNPDPDHPFTFFNPHLHPPPPTSNSQSTYSAHPPLSPPPRDRPTHAHNPSLSRATPAPPTNPHPSPPATRISAAWRRPEERPCVIGAMVHRMYSTVQYSMASPPSKRTYVRSSTTMYSTVHYPPDVPHGRTLSRPRSGSGRACESGG